MFFSPLPPPPPFFCQPKLVLGAACRAYCKDGSQRACLQHATPPSWTDLFDAIQRLLFHPPLPHCSRVPQDGLEKTLKYLDSSPADSSLVFSASFGADGHEVKASGLPNVAFHAIRLERECWSILEPVDRHSMHFFVKA